ncbi:transposase [Methylobacterium fujisawaense]|uniref:transposase n=1 Tax=Methylobacterium fujisawaense TaxID=107400 RepID=UPI003AF964CE
MKGFNGPRRSWARCGCNADRRDARVRELDRRRIAALACLAPLARESGKRVGPRSIGGGRPVVRTILYLACIQASGRFSIFREYRPCLRLAGKPRADLTASARKLLGYPTACSPHIPTTPPW